MSLTYTRAIIDAINEGTLAKVDTKAEPFFGLAIPESCPGVPSELLNPKATWANAAAYDATAKKLQGLFRKNFQKFSDKASPEIIAAGPTE